MVNEVDWDLYRILTEDRKRERDCELNGSGID